MTMTTEHTHHHNATITRIRALAQRARTLGARQLAARLEQAAREREQQLAAARAAQGGTDHD